MRSIAFADFLIGIGICLCWKADVRGKSEAGCAQGDEECASATPDNILQAVKGSSRPWSA